MVSVPIVGSIACGSPMLAKENIEAYVPILRNELGGSEFLLFILMGIP